MFTHTLVCVVYNVSVCWWLHV